MDNFPFILFDNRDEVFARPTAPAQWWPDNPNIFAPRDLLKEEKGTWIGVSRNGRIAVLVNKFRKSDDARLPAAKISRGSLPAQFLTSKLSPSEWVTKTEKENKDELSNCGGFTMLAIETKGRDIDMQFLSNYDNRITTKKSHISMALSNGEYNDDSWVKVKFAENSFRELRHIKDTSELIESGFNILGTKSQYPVQCREDFRKSIFIPQIKLAEGVYGTRTKTAIVYDGSSITYSEFDVASGSQSVETFKVSNEST